MGILGNVASNAIGGVMGLALGGINDARQIRQQEKLQAMQIRGQKEMTDYNTQKSYGMWLNTGVKGQMAQIKQAGLNPALMYNGSGGGGGSTMASGTVSGGSAPSGGGEVQGMTGMALQMRAQNELLAAQKENVEADTVNKKAEATYTGGVKTEETRAGGLLKENQALETDLRNMLSRYMQETDNNGNQTQIDGSIAATGKRQEIEGQRLDNVLTNGKINEVKNKIELMNQQGLNIEQATSNLEKDGTIKDAEIAWNKLGLKQGDAGKFIVELLKKLIKGR